MTTNDDFTGKAFYNSLTLEQKLERKIAQLEATCEKMRSALDWYADESNYFPRNIIRHLKDKTRLARVYGDLGEKAREALKEGG
jgi:hypothetical protein